MHRAGAEIMGMDLQREINCSRFQYNLVYFTNQHWYLDQQICARGG
jgi:hypothetical protein